MNNTFSLQKIPKTSTLGGNLISRQYKLNLMMVDFMRMKYENPNGLLKKLKHGMLMRSSK